MHSFQTTERSKDQILKASFEKDFLLGGSKFFIEKTKKHNFDYQSQEFSKVSDQTLNFQLEFCKSIAINYFQVGSDEYFMAIVLLAAHYNMQHCSINPCVSCVYVIDKKIASFGYTTNSGKDHAEVNAAQRLNAFSLIKKSHVYVSLEPCCHRAEKSCSNFLIKYQAKKVIIALQDPDKRVDSKGIKLLKKNNIDLKVGVLKECAQKLYSRYIIHRKNNHRICIGSKWAQSLDAKLASSDGRSQWISCQKSLVYSQWLRYAYDAIMVGSQTVINDKPALTLRHKFITNHLNSPVKIIFDPNLSAFCHDSFLDHYNYLKQNDSLLIWLTKSDKYHLAKNHKNWKNLDLLDQSRFLFKLSAGNVVESLRSCLDSKEFLDVLHKPIMSLLVEGGPRLHGLLIANKLVDFLHIVTSAKIFSGDYGCDFSMDQGMIDTLDQSSTYEIVSNTMLGSDILVELKKKL